MPEPSAASLTVDPRALEDPTNRPALRALAFERAFRPILGGIVHELRNQLQSVTGVLPLMLEGAAEDVPESLRAMASTGVEHGLAAVAALTELVELPADGAPGPTAVADLVYGAVRLHGFRRRSATAPVQADLASVPPLPCTAFDGTCALLLLLNNAAESLADRDGGTITLTAHRSGDDVAIEVRDDGDGFGEVAAERAFEPYVSGRPRHDGLGLPVARALAGVAGGEVAVISAARGDVRVAIRWPAWRAPA